MRLPRPGHLPVIAIGSSANGVHALGAIVAALPADLPAAIVMVQHAADSREPLLAGLLGRQAHVRVKTAEHDEMLIPGTVYVARPGVHVVVSDGRLRLETGAKVAYSRPSIDVLFASIARTCAGHGVGVLLSGGGRDGAAGLAEIRRAGGLTIVQEPREAASPGMPRAALAFDGHVVLRLGDIAPTLVQIARGLAQTVDEERSVS